MKQMKQKLNQLNNKCSLFMFIKNENFLLKVYEKQII